MSAARVIFPVCAFLGVCAGAYSAPLPCLKPGTERWKVKTSLPPGPPTKTMTLADALNLQKLTDVAKDDKRYDSNRIMDQPVKEDTLVTISGYL